MFLFPRTEFTALVFKRNCSKGDSNQCPLGYKSSTLTPRPSMQIPNVKDINVLKKEIYIWDRIEDRVGVRHRNGQGHRRKDKRTRT
jgi:hypothetical protein